MNVENVIEEMCIMFLQFLSVHRRSIDYTIFKSRLLKRVIPFGVIKQSSKINSVLSKLVYRYFNIEVKGIILVMNYKYHVHYGDTKCDRLLQENKLHVLYYEYNRNKTS